MNWMDDQDWARFMDLFRRAHGRTPDAEEQEIVAQMGMYHFNLYMDELESQIDA